MLDVNHVYHLLLIIVGEWLVIRHLIQNPVMFPKYGHILVLYLNIIYLVITLSLEVSYSSPSKVLPPYYIPPPPLLLGSANKP
jgi:hypothetical protein